ncbi:MAG: ABC transporter ATP-binding protein [Aggregatilineales bacterium]
MAVIRLENLRKEFGKLVAVRDLTMTFPTSSVTCLLGPSGCGKTTLMRMIAGLEEPTRGEIYFDDERVTDLTPSERNIGMVFQYPVIYRGMTVYRNIELPLLEDKTLSPAQRRQRVESVMDTLDLTRFASAGVDRLDNGTRQKVAVAREVARQPRIILFDEPVTNVDIASKLQLKRALKRLVKQHSQTIIYVTHDQTEAMTLADEIALMRDGAIVQRGAPRDLYNNPADRFGGWFLGNPGMNFVDCSLTPDADSMTLAGPLFQEPVRVDGVDGRREVVLGIRPERVRVLRQPTPNSVEARVVQQALVAGGQHLLTLEIGGAVVKAKVSPEMRFSIGERAHVVFPLEHIVLFEPQEGLRLDAALAPLAAPTN